MQDDVQQRAVDVQRPVVFNEAHISEFVHEKAEWPRRFISPRKNLIVPDEKSPTTDAGVKRPRRARRIAAGPSDTRSSAAPPSRYRPFQTVWPMVATILLRSRRPEGSQVCAGLQACSIWLAWVPLGNAASFAVPALSVARALVVQKDDVFPNCKSLCARARGQARRILCSRCTKCYRGYKTSSEVSPARRSDQLRSADIAVRQDVMSGRYQKHVR